MAVNFRCKCAKRGAVAVVSAFMRNAAVFGSIGERGVILDRKRVKIRTECNSACRDGLRSDIQRSLVHGIEPCTHIMQLKRSVRAEKINERCFCLFFLPGKLRAAVKPMPKYDGSFKNIFIHCGNTSRLNNNGNRKSVSETGHKPHACFGRNNYTPERTGSKQRICFTRAYFRTCGYCGFCGKSGIIIMERQYCAERGLI